MWNVIINEEWEIAFLFWNPWLSKTFFRVSYQALRVCFNHYIVLDNLQTWTNLVESMEPSGWLINIIFLRQPLRNALFISDYLTSRVLVSYSLYFCGDWYHHKLDYSFLIISNLTYVNVVCRDLGWNKWLLFHIKVIVICWNHCLSNVWSTCNRQRNIDTWTYN